MSSRIIPPPPPGWASWEALMLLALKEAHRAEALGEVPVGALIVSAKGHIIGTGHNQVITLSDPSAHAEILALRQAGAAIGNYRLSGCTMVVTLEPCLMCTGAIVHARLSGLVFGGYDTKTGTVHSCLDGLDQPFHNASVWHLGDILQAECLTILQNFFTSKRSSL